MTATAEQVRAALNSLDYPAMKEQIVEHAETAGAEEDVVRSLRALPLAEYANVGEVLRSVPLQGGT